MPKGQLVRDSTLAQLSDRFGITDRLVATPSAFYTTRAQQNTKGSMFESWVAAFYYSLFVGEEGPTRDAVA
jgi:dsRNA-specific ribonuclease